MQRVGIFGLSGNPPHVAHVYDCFYALMQKMVDLVAVIPVYKHPFDKELLPFDDRLMMIYHAFKPISSGVMILHVEREIFEKQGGQGPVYTFDVLNHLSNTYFKKADFRLILGEDIRSETDRWHRWEDVARIAPPIFLPRGQYGGNTNPDISSTAIRKMIAAGNFAEAAKVLPFDVLEFIRQNGLYMEAVHV